MLRQHRTLIANILFISYAIYSIAASSGIFGCPFTYFVYMNSLLLLSFFVEEQSNFRYNLGMQSIVLPRSSAFLNVLRTN